MKVILSQNLYLDRITTMRHPRKLSPQTVAVLLALADQASRWSHGYDLCRRLGLKAGTVYPILMRLAERGHLETSWEQPDVVRGRPARHLYRLSLDGAKLAKELQRTDRGRAAFLARAVV